MRKLVSIKFGSHLYGTSTPASDVDLKSVYLPDAQSILLQRVKGSITNQRQKNQGEKNYAGEVDEESYSLQRFLSLAAEGQTVALDVLFAPEWSMVEPPSAEWREITQNRAKLITRKSAAFVGYCRQQANKYGIKGSRVAAAREALKTLEHYAREMPPSAKLGQIENIVKHHVATTEHMSIDEITQTGGLVIQYWNVCGRKLQFTATVKHARDVIAGLVDEYGKRSLQAENNQGVDWKALSHAVRVGTQALELLSTGHVTFPLLNAGHVKAIKLGQLPYQEVSAEIENLLERVEAAALISKLPPEPDHDWIAAFVADVYGSQVKGDTLVERARTFAIGAHESIGQKRKYTNTPYFKHPLAVADLVRSVPHTKTMLAAAYLHDVVEDTGVSLETIDDLFGAPVADLVFWLTDQSKPSDGNREKRKAIDRAHSASAPPAAQTIKLADLIDNTATINQHDPEFAKVYRKEKEALLRVMDKGDPSLLKRAWEQLAAFDEDKLQAHFAANTFVKRG